MFPMTAAEFDLVYNALSFTLASMMASTLFFWLRLSSVHEKYKSAMTITGLVTFIAACMQNAKHASLFGVALALSSDYRALDDRSLLPHIQLLE